MQCINTIIMHLFKLYGKCSSTQRAILRSVKSFCEKELVPRVRSDYKNEHTDKTIFKKMGDMGIFGSHYKRIWMLR